MTKLSYKLRHLGKKLPRLGRFTGEIEPPQKASMRDSFTHFWQSLSSNAKSFCISLGAIILAIVLLKVSAFLFPTADFTATTAVVITALSGFIVNICKEQTLTQ